MAGWVGVASDDALRALSRRWEPVLGTRLVRLASSGHAAGVTSLYQRPSQLGVDRWAALVGAWHLQRQMGWTGPALVVSSGTATTVDHLSADGCFPGGTITPGWHLMRDSLASGTARLPRAEGQVVAFPRCTDDAIATGVAHAQVGVVWAAWQRARMALASSGGTARAGGAGSTSQAGVLSPDTTGQAMGPRLWLTGGGAQALQEGLAVLAPELCAQVEVVPSLVLEGVRVLLMEASQEGLPCGSGDRSSLRPCGSPVADDGPGQPAPGGSA